MQVAVGISAVKPSHSYALGSYVKLLQAGPRDMAANRTGFHLPGMSFYLV